MNRYAVAAYVVAAVCIFGGLIAVRNHLAVAISPAPPGVTMSSTSPSVDWRTEASRALAGYAAPKLEPPPEYQDITPESADVYLRALRAGVPVAIAYPPLRPITTKVSLDLSSAAREAWLNEAYVLAGRPTAYPGPVDAAAKAAGVPGFIENIPVYGRQEVAETVYNLTRDESFRRQARGEWE